MVDPNAELVAKLKDVGKKLAAPPRNVGNLLSILDETLSVLRIIRQSPPSPIEKALRPTMEALVTNELLEHTDMDVKLLVVACLSAITTITVPEPPYKSDVMKKIAGAIVDSFKELDDMSSDSFPLRVYVLETAASVRFYIVMLDIGCDDLILQMFQHFLKTVRFNHSGNIINAMEDIMTDTLKESDSVSQDLFLCLISPLTEANKDVLPIAQKLAHKVVTNCEAKLKSSCLCVRGFTSAPLKEYNELLTSICGSESYAEEQPDKNASVERLISGVQNEEDLGMNLIGSMIKVLWPDDNQFYAGVVDSYDSISGKHKILYTDGDVEMLLLKNECWEYVNGGGEIDMRQKKLIREHDASSRKTDTANMIKDGDKRKSGDASVGSSKKRNSLGQLKTTPNSAKKQRTPQVLDQIKESSTLKDIVSTISSSKSQKRSEKQSCVGPSSEKIVEKKQSSSALVCIPQALQCTPQTSKPSIGSKISMTQTPSRGARLLQQFIQPVSPPVSAPTLSKEHKDPPEGPLYNTRAIAEIRKLFYHFKNGDFKGLETPYEMSLDDEKINVSEPARTIFPKFFEIYPQAPTYASNKRTSHREKVEMWFAVVGLFLQVCEDVQEGVLSNTYKELEKEIQVYTELGFSLQPLQYVIEIINNGQKKVDTFRTSMQYIHQLISAHEASLKEAFPVDAKQKDLEHSLVAANEALKADENKLEVLKSFVFDLEDKIATTKGEIESIKKDLQNIELRRAKMAVSGDTTELKRLEKDYQSMKDELAEFNNFLEDTGIIKNIGKPEESTATKTPPPESSHGYIKNTTSETRNDASGMSRELVLYSNRISRRSRGKSVANGTRSERKVNTRSAKLQGQKKA